MKETPGQLLDLLISYHSTLKCMCQTPIRCCKACLFASILNVTRIEDLENLASIYKEELDAIRKSQTVYRNL